MGFGNRNTKSAKLTLTKVAEIRERYETGETQGSLARMFGVSIGQIGRIVRGESWQQREAQAPLVVPPAQEVYARVQQRIENGSLVPGEKKVRGEESHVREGNWFDGLTEGEVKLAKNSINFGMSEWVARETVLKARNINKGGEE